MLSMLAVLGICVGYMYVCGVWSAPGAVSACCTSFFFTFILFSAWSSSELNLNLLINV